MIQEKQESSDDKMIEEAISEDMVEKSDDKSVVDKIEKQELLDKKLEKVADMLSKLNNDELIT